MERDQVLFRLLGKFCPEGTILFTEGSPGEELFLIQSGAVRLGEERDGAAPTLGPGDLLGEEAFFGGINHSSRAVTVADSRLIQVSNRTVGSLVRHGPETARHLLDRLLNLACSARQELAAWSVEHLLPRLAPELVEAAHGSIDAADLAERSGVTVSDARLVLEELRRRGCLAREGTRYRVADPDRLRRAIDGMVAAGGRT